MAWFERAPVRIRYEERGAGDPVLLLPGLGGRIEEMTSVIDALSPEFRVVAADLPQAMIATGAGHGVSWDQPEWLNRTLLGS